MNSDELNRRLEPWQSRTAEPTPYENHLADALQRIFAAGATELDEVVERLNAMGVADPSGRTWTAETFRDAVRRLGA